METIVKTINSLKLGIIYLSMLMLQSCTTPTKDINPNNKSKDKMNDKTPFLTAPKVRKVWIPEKIENDKFIEGHYMWILEKTSSWSQ